MWFYLDQISDRMFPTCIGPRTSNIAGNSLAISPMSIPSISVEYQQPAKNPDVGYATAVAGRQAPTLAEITLTVNNPSVLRGLVAASANHTPFGIITGGVTTLTVRHGAINPLPSEGLNDVGYYSGSIANGSNLNFLSISNVDVLSLPSLADKATKKTIATGVIGFTSTFGKSSSLSPENFEDNFFGYIGDGTLILAGDAITEITTIALSYTGSGDLIISGEAEVFTANYNYTSSGGMVIDGTADARLAISDTASGGMVLGGDADWFVTGHYIGSGDLVLGGDGGTTNDFAYSTSGGLILGGEALIPANFFANPLGNVFSFEDITDGGGPLGPILIPVLGEINFIGGGGLDGDEDFIIPLGVFASINNFGSPMGPFLLFSDSEKFYVGSGTLVIAGDAEAIQNAYAYTGSGDLVLGGDADEQLGAYAYTGSGDLVLGGDGVCRITLAYAYTGNGNLVLAGSAVAAVKTRNRKYTTTGTMILGGSAISSGSAYNYTSVGGVSVLSGTAIGRRTSYRYHAIGGMVLGGKAVGTRTGYHWYGGGDPILGGSAIVTTSAVPAPTFAYIGGDDATPALTLGSNIFFPTIATVTFFATQDINWQINGTVSNEIEFLWNVGRQPSYWYRVTGVCLNPTCDNSGIDLDGQNCNLGSGGETFTQIIAGTDLADVCRQLTAKYALNWQISNISRWSRPVSTTDIEAQEAAGIDHSCNRLESVDFSQVPECLDLTAESTSPIRMGMTAVIQDQFLSFVGGGTLYLFGSAKVNSYNYVGGGGFILDGSADTSLSNNYYTGSGDLIIAGEAGVVFQDWHYTAFGGLVLGGEAEVLSNYYAVVTSGGLTISGDTQTSAKLSYTSTYPLITLGGSALIANQVLNFSYTGNGDMIIDGTATSASDTWNYQGDGDLLLGGEALTVGENQHYEAGGDIVLGGTAVIVWSQIAEGGFVLGGSSIGLPFLPYIANGQMILGGEAETQSVSYSYEVDGDGIILGGAAVARSNYFEGSVTLGGRIANVLLEADFTPTESDGPPIPADDDGTVNTNCGCNPVSLSLSMSHNFNNANILGDFVRRNNLTFGTSMQLRYRKLDQTWQQNFHFSGISQRNTLERWTMVFEWGCTSNLAGSPLDQPAWKFSASIVRKDAATGEDSDTRILYVFPKEIVCQRNLVEFAFTVNTRTGVAAAKGATEILGNILYDNIGLFKSKFWTTNPLKINIASVAEIENTDTFDIFPIFPADENIFVT